MKISDEVLEVLDDITTDGLKAVITRQLDRKLYVKVNTVLVACGGAWSRKDKAHVFRDDARAILDAAIVTGEVTTSADIGFFPTPPDLARTLVDAADIRPGHSVLEPSAGTGALIDAILEAGPARILAFERDPGMRFDLAVKYGRTPTHLDRVVDIDGENDPNLLDFLDAPPEPRVDRVVMNPPFTRVGRGDHLDHVRHAFEFLKPGGVIVSVLPSGVTFRKDRRYSEFRSLVEEQDGEITALPEGSFKVSGTGVNTAMLRMCKQG